MDWMHDSSHRRYNPLTGQWVLVSPHRMKRPWQGAVEPLPPPNRPAYDPGCYLCPGNGRAGGQQNPPYTGTYVFDNDFSALSAEATSGEWADGLLQARAESGRCRVVCFSPRHDLALAQLPPDALRDVVDTWQHEWTALGAEADIGYVTVFENKGEVMGCSNPHPHGQIWAQRTVPTLPANIQTHLHAYYRQHARPLLLDYLATELQRNERIVWQNAHWVWLVPFWALWPFETLLLPRRHLTGMDAWQPEEAAALAEALAVATRTYDALFQTSFPYSAGWHQRPTDGAPHPEWQLYLQFLPPLLRSATVRKFMVGYELLGEPQRDLTAESAAARLRDLAGS